MRRKVLVSATTAEALANVPPSERRRIRRALEGLAEGPLTARAGMEIKRLRATTPVKHRLKVGAYRVVYVVERGAVKVLDVFRRERGYRE